MFFGGEVLDKAKHSKITISEIIKVEETMVMMWAMEGV